MPVYLPDITITKFSKSLLSSENGACAFAENDPYGLYMAIIGMTIVFSILIMLFVVFSNTPVIFTQEFRNKVKSIILLKKTKDESHGDLPGETSKTTKQELSGEVNAAIATAIYLYRNELHDHENTVLTIKKVSRRYSPWNSKIYGLRNNHNTYRR